MKYLKSFNEGLETLRVLTNKYLSDEGYQISYDIYVGDEYIGDCEIRTVFKNDEFNDDKPDEYTNNNEKFDYKNPVKKSDFDNNRYVIYLSDFEIEEEYRGQGYGFKSMKIILKKIQTLLPKNDGIYLSVFKDNHPAVKIYEKLGFKIIKEYKFSTGEDVLEMKY